MPRSLRLITFRIGPETFAADIMAIRQVIMDEGSTAVPGAPRFVEGVILFRGDVLPVIDLRPRFFPAAGKAEQPLLMIASTQSGLIALKVDEVRNLATITTDDLLQPPAVVRGVKNDYLVAMVERRDELLLVLDLDAILTADEKQAVAGMIE